MFAATDSVAVLQLLDPGRSPQLFSLVFGEGIVNDATSVVLLGALARMAQHGGAGQGWVAAQRQGVARVRCVGEGCGLGVGQGVGDRPGVGWGEGWALARMAQQGASGQG